MEFSDLHKKLAERFQRKPEKLPKLEIHVRYISHHSYEDARRLKEELKDMDIFIPERVLWSPINENIDNKVAHGSLTAAQAIAEERAKGFAVGNFRQGQLEALEGTGVTVAYADIPEGDPRTEEFLDLFDFESNPNTTIAAVQESGSLEELVQVFKEKSLKFAEFQMERERYMISHLEEAVANAMKRNQSLKKRDSLKVFMFIGSSHHGFHRKISASVHEDTKGSIRDKTVTFIPTLELARTYERTGSVENALVRKALIENLISPVYEQILRRHPVGHSDVLLRTVIDEFTDYDLEEMYKLVKAGKQEEFTIFAGLKIEAVVQRMKK